MPDSPIAEHVKKHGDGVRDIALQVDDADFAFHEAVRRGAEAVEEPHDISRRAWHVRRAAVHTYGDTIHSLISFGLLGPFLPGYAAGGSDRARRRAFCASITSWATSSSGKMNYWADYYQNVFGFHRFISFDDKDISTEYSALMSIVMSDDSYSVKFPINEPAPGRRKSQIDEYLEAYCGAGVQHIALQSKDILYTVDRLKQNGVEFLRVPDNYYETLPERVGQIDEPIEAIRDLGILVDRDQDGYLLQIFTQARGGPADGVLRDHPAQGQPRIRQRKFQGAVRGHRGRAGPAGQSVIARSRWRPAHERSSSNIRADSAMSSPAKPSPAHCRSGRMRRRSVLSDSTPSN